MIVIDVFAIVFLLIYMVLGIRGNFISELLKVAVMLLVFLVVYFLHPHLMDKIDVVQRFIKIGAGAYQLTFLILFLSLSWFLGGSATRIIDKITSFEDSKVIGHVISGFIGTVRGVIYLGAMLLLVTAAIPNSSTAAVIQKGKVTSFAMNTVTDAYRFLDKYIMQHDISPNSLEEDLFNFDSVPAADNALDDISSTLEEYGVSLEELERVKEEAEQAIRNAERNNEN